MRGVSFGGGITSFRCNSPTNFPFLFHSPFVLFLFHSLFVLFLFHSLFVLFLFLILRHRTNQSANESEKYPVLTISARSPASTRLAAIISQPREPEPEQMNGWLPDYYHIHQSTIIYTERTRWVASEQERRKVVQGRDTQFGKKHTHNKKTCIPR